MDHLDPPTHRMRALGLMLSRTSGQANRRMHLLHRGLHRLLQAHTVAQHQQALAGLAPSLANGFDRLARALLQRHDMRLDITGGALGFTRQRTHLVRHHRKATPGLTGTRRFDGRVERQQVGLLGDAVDHCQHHFDLLALRCQALDDFGTGLYLPRQRFDQAADFSRRARVFIGSLANIHHLLQRSLHRMAFGLGLIGHLRQRAQALGHFVALQTRRRVGAGIAQGHRADFHTGTLRHIAGLAHDGLQLIHKAIDRRSHVADLIFAVDLHALGQVALARRQVIHGRDQQFQTIDYPPPEHHRDQQQDTKADHRKPHADAPTQRTRRFLHDTRGVSGHLGSGRLRRLQPRAHGGCTIRRSALEAVTHQLIAAGNQCRKALIQRQQVGLYRRGRDAHADLADLDTVGADGRFDVVHGGVRLGGVQHFIERAVTLALFQQSLVDRVFPVQIAGQMLTGSVVIHHEQHVGIALGPSGELRQRRHIVVPHGAGRHGGQQLRHVISGVLQVFFQGRTQLLLLFLQARGKPCGQTLTGTARQAVQAGRDFLAGLSQFARQFLTVDAQAIAQISFQRRDCAPS